jgi:hypothetical protein
MSRTILNDVRIMTTESPDQREVERALIEEARRRRQRRHRWIEASLSIFLFGAVVTYGIGHYANSAAPKTTTNSSSVPSVAANAPRCSSPQLSLASNRGGWHGNFAAANQFTETVTFTNVSHSACQLAGWPQVQVMANGPYRLAGVSDVFQASPSKPVRLEPKGTASFDIYGAVWNAIVNQACSTVVSGLMVTPPRDTKGVFVKVEEPDCGAFYISVVIAGSSDRQSWTSVDQKSAPLKALPGVASRIVHVGSPDGHGECRRRSLCSGGVGEV